MQGIYWDNGKENENYYLGFRVSGFRVRYGSRGVMKAYPEILSLFVWRPCSSSLMGSFPFRWVWKVLTQR